MDYQTHRYKLMTNLSSNFVFNLALREMNRLYEKMINNIQQKQDFSLMAPMHTNLSGLKALVCNHGYEGTKIMRELCGAMGFHKNSGIPECIV